MMACYWTTLSFLNFGVFIELHKKENWKKRDRENYLVILLKCEKGDDIQGMKIPQFFIYGFHSSHNDVTKL